MVLCEHFVYASAEIEGKKGYQVIAKSSGISAKILDELEDYLYPIGINSSEFRESKSALILQKNVVYTRVKNIGIGPDGRPDTIYSHTILMSLNDFEKFNNDTRIFNEYFKIDAKPGHLTPLVIKPTKLKSDFSCIDEIGIFRVEQFLRAMFSNNKVALLDIESIDIIQSLLSLTPYSLRLISFSTTVVKPVRQSNYHLIQIPRQNRSELNSFVFIDPREKISVELDSSLFEQAIEFIINLIESKNDKKLTKIYDQVEDISLNSIKEKLTIVSKAEQIESNSKYRPTVNEINEILQILDKIDPISASKYFPKFAKFVEEESAQDYSKKFESLRIISKYDQNELDIHTLGKIFDEQSKGTAESRNALFHKLVEKRLPDFQKNGAKILGDIIQRFYNNDVIRGFVEEPRLHSSFEQVFDKNYELKDIHKQELFSFAVQNSLCHNHDFLEKLFTFEIHDIQNDSHAEMFKETIKWLFSAKEFHRDFRPEKIFVISKSIYDRVYPIFSQKRKSGTMEKNCYYLQEVLNTILNTLRYLLTVRRYSLGVDHKKIQDFENNLSHFLNINYLPRKSIYDVLPSSDIGKIVPSVGTWILFVTFSNKCKK